MKSIFFEKDINKLGLLMKSISLIKDIKASTSIWLHT